MTHTHLEQHGVLPPLDAVAHEVILGDGLLVQLHVGLILLG